MVGRGPASEGLSNAVRAFNACIGKVLRRERKGRGDGSGWRSSAVSDVVLRICGDREAKAGCCGIVEKLFGSCRDGVCVGGGGRCGVVKGVWLGRDAEGNLDVGVRVGLNGGLRRFGAEGGHVGPREHCGERTECGEAPQGERGQHEKHVAKHGYEVRARDVKVVESEPGN